jgi:hypothetical protein
MQNFKTFWNYHKKENKVENQKIEGMTQFVL